MLETLISSKTRVRLLLKFFSNSKTRTYLRGLANEFDVSSNAIRIELNRLFDAGLITSEKEGRRRIYRANTKHPLYPELMNLTRKNLGLDRVEQIINKLGTVKLALVTGDYANGIDSGLIDLLIVGSVNKPYLAKLTYKAESLTGRRIRTLVVTENEYREMKNNKSLRNALVLWSNNGKETAD